jgi:hypothetical protein
MVETVKSVALPEPDTLRPVLLGCINGIVLYSELVQGISPTAEKTSGLSVINPSPPLVRVTLASLEECNILLQNGLDFYGATFFPTEAAVSTSGVRNSGKKSILGNRYSNNDSYHGTSQCRGIVKLLTVVIKAWQ